VIGLRRKGSSQFPPYVPVLRSSDSLMECSGPVSSIANVATTGLHGNTDYINTFMFAGPVTTSLLTLAWILSELINPDTLSRFAISSWDWALLRHPINSALPAQWITRYRLTRCHLVHFQDGAVPPARIAVHAPNGVSCMFRSKRSILTKGSEARIRGHLSRCFPHLFPFHLSECDSARIRGIG
jgi:hypothetical protein